MTMDDVARLAGVSKKTVSRFFNNSPLISVATREKLDTVVAQTGFVPNAQARGLALRRNFLIALIHDGTQAGIVEAVEAGMLAALEGSDMALVLRPMLSQDTRSLHRFLEQHRPAGVVLLPPLSEMEVLADICRQAGVRCMRLGRCRGDRGFASDDRAAMASMVTWLVRQGHMRIGFISGPETSRSAQERELGFLDAMADHDLDRGPSLIVAGDNSFASGVEAGRLLFEVSPRPSAIIACNDEMAAGVLQAAAKAGIAIPEDLSVVGFDDTPISVRTSPPLTTMRVPWRDMALHAVSALLSPDAELPIPDFHNTIVMRDSVLPRLDTPEADAALIWPAVSAR